MITLISSLIAMVCYLLGTFFQGRELRSDSPRRGRVLLLGWLAVLAHLAVLSQEIPGPAGFDFGFFKVASLVSWTIVLLALLSSLGRPLENLFLGLFPLALICLAGGLLLPSSYPPQSGYGGGVALHILLGILSLSVITIAAFQALLVSFLSRLLRRKQSFAVISHLPPLETMEALLFDMIWLGLGLLSGVIITGVLFMEDFFGQHLSHKTVFSIVSWAVFAMLLWGRHRLGWRSRVANRWLLVGFAFLILAYFGSKFVLEIILDRV